MKKIAVFIMLILLMSAVPVSGAGNDIEKITMDEGLLVDKIIGGWIGQMAGVSWAAPTEFEYIGRIIPENEVPEWTPEMIIETFDQDDIYVEIPFMDAMKDHGVNVGWDILGEYFKNTEFRLWHANSAARENLKQGIKAPDSGHYIYNKHCDDIDWQIEADFIGMICPGQVNTAIELAWRIGHVMNYGDGVYGGVFMSAMHAKAFKASSVDEIIEAGRQAVPEGSLYRQVIEDVIQWKEGGRSWEQVYALLKSKWLRTDRCPAGRSIVNIDAKLNGAYVLMGLLYGEGDFEKSMEIAMRCGQDSDCNASSVGGILGNWMGESKIPEKWKSALANSGMKFSFTEYDFASIVVLNIELAKQVLALNKGEIS